MRYASILIAAFFLFSTIGWSLGVRINTTRSVPLGVYITTDSPVSVGSYVSFCPPDNKIFAEARSRGYIDAGFCTGGYGHMAKKVLAAKNDIVSVTSQSVSVNGVVVPMSKPLTTDNGNRPMPIYRVDRHTLADNELLLMSDITGLSFDARYFGLIDTKQIDSVITPIITWQEGPYKTD